MSSTIFTEALLLNEWEEMEQLQEFMQSETLRKLQADSGVVGQPEIFIFDEVEEGSV